MASTSARAQMDTAGRIRNAADTLSSDNQSLIAVIFIHFNLLFSFFFLPLIPFFYPIFRIFEKLLIV